ncbi:hypothetical protein [Azospirillum sp. Marseille-Q6669]
MTTSYRFGDRVEMIAASDANPQKFGFFIRRGTSKAKFNGGSYIEMTDGKGDVWRTPPDNVRPAPPLAVEAAPDSDALKRERYLSRDLMDLLKSMFDAPTMAAGYAILADFARQWWPEDPVALRAAPDLTERADMWWDDKDNETPWDSPEDWARNSGMVGGDVSTITFQRAVSLPSITCTIECIDDDETGEREYRVTYDRENGDAARVYAPAAAPQPPLPIGYIPLPVGLHPDTADLVTDFAAALAEKLLLAEAKYRLRDEWKRDDWREKLISDVVEHVHKGDPLDVAAYCAFAWFHGWSIAPAAAPGGVEGWRPPSEAPTEKGAPILLKFRISGGDTHIGEGHVTETGHLWVPYVSFHRDDPNVLGVIALSASPAAPAEQSGEGWRPITEKHMTGDEWLLWCPADDPEICIGRYESGDEEDGVPAIGWVESASGADIDPSHALPLSVLPPGPTRRASAPAPREARP